MDKNVSQAKQNRLGEIFGPTADCLEIDELALVLAGRRGEASQSMARAHVDACAYCSTELALLDEFENAAAQPGEQADVDAIVARLRKASPTAPQPWWESFLERLWTPRMLAPVSIAFAAVLIAITVGVQSRHYSGQPVVLPEHEVTRSQSVAVVSPIGDQTEAPHQLQWRAVDGANRYRVQFMEVDRTELWSTTVTQTSTPLPNNIRQEILPLKTLLWQVTALDAAGQVLASSGFQSFRVQSR
ncbi:MAG: hypothetical protein M3Z32_01935 [Acidobacteriota bacterium]|nr:hypothetical protein [Acidobacteriota bacterium]